MKQQKHYHLIGIGGIGMSAIARLLLSHGTKVSGSDEKESRATRELTRLGAQITIGHSAATIDSPDQVIYSSAIKEDNPEIREAKKKSIPVIRRAQALADLMKDKTVIAVTGSHGKTTTASLVSFLLLEAKLSPTIAVGGILKNIDSNASFGEGKFLVAEADESDGSFLCYHPHYSIITNIDYEHLDYYKTFENELAAFREFIHTTDRNGCLFCCNDDQNIKMLLQGYTGSVIRFGLHKDADIYPQQIIFKGLSSEFDCIYKGTSLGRFLLALGGLHNISNALSAIALGLELGIDLKVIRHALQFYQGTLRRLEVKFQDATGAIIDDYAHHPTEIKATLAAAKEMGYRRIIAVFEPHRYTRTHLLLEEFAKSFHDAEYVVVTDIYAASELPIEGVSGACLCDAIKKQSTHGQVEFIPKAGLVKRILEIFKPGDLVITLGAGDITKVCDELVQAYTRKS